MIPPRVAQGHDKRLYFLGFKENLQEVFGPNHLMAFLPVANRSVISQSTVYMCIYMYTVYLCFAMYVYKGMSH